MRDLHVVALSEDGRHVVLATTPDARRGGFRVALDDRLQAAVKGELSRSGHVPSETMSVREIQARLRAGESVEDLARAGVPLARIERFAGPVLSERDQVVAQARKAVLVRGRRGPSSLPLGEAVDRRLAELPSLRPDSTSWTSWKGEDGLWTVEVSWHSRSRTRSAQWRYDVAARTVVPVDPASASLGHVDQEGSDADAPAPTRPGRAGSRAKGSRGSSAGASSTRSRGSAPSRPGADDHDHDHEHDDDHDLDAHHAGDVDVTDDRDVADRAGVTPGARSAPPRRSRGAVAGSSRAPAERGAAPRRRPQAGATPAPAGQDSPRPAAVPRPTTRRPAPSPLAHLAVDRPAGAPTTAAGPAPDARRAAPAPFGPAAVAAVRRSPAAPRPAAATPARPPAGRSRPATAAPARTSPPLRPRPSHEQEATAPRVVAGEGGLVVPAPGTSRPAPAPAGPPALRVVPRGDADVEDERAADVS